jgi:hypothetical protein
LERVEVMGRVAKQDLKLTDAAAVLELSYCQSAPPDRGMEKGLQRRASAHRRP